MSIIAAHIDSEVPMPAHTSAMPMMALVESASIFLTLPSVMASSDAIKNVTAPAEIDINPAKLEMPIAGAILIITSIPLFTKVTA